MDENDINLTNKQQLIFNACLKIEQGRLLLKQGKIELDELTGTSTPPVNYGKDVATFKLDTRDDQKLEKRVLDFLKKGPQSTFALQKSLRAGGRRANRIIGNLEKAGKIKNAGEEGRRAWVLASKAKSPASRIEVVDEALVKRTLDFLKTDDWVSKQKLIKTLHISWKPSERLLAHLTNEGLIKTVRKKNNPNHKNHLAVYNQTLPYITLA